MNIACDRSITQDFDEALSREWLETNGLGGWASSSIIGVNTRRYHGMLVAATAPPVGRVVLLSKLDETIQIQGARFELGSNRFPAVVHPRGYEYLSSFTKGLFPVFTYEAGGVVLRKTIAAVNGENTTVVLYHVLEAPSPFVLELQPLFSPRDYHSLSHENDALHPNARFDLGTLRLQSYEGMPELFIGMAGSEFELRPMWYRSFEYGMEKSRGLDFMEDLFSLGVFRRPLKRGERIGVIISTAAPNDRNAFKLFGEEETRRLRLYSSLPLKDDLTQTLALAADQFLVNRGSDLKTLIAGYHWFTDWGRDTMIALPGICLVTGRFHEAKKILRAFSRSVSEGMLPNRFPDAGGRPEYNSVDATLWFFIAIYRYLHYTRDDGFVRDELMPIMRIIIAWLDRGTRYSIHVDRDGLLSAGQRGVPLTWMDAKVDDCVTPRQGKAVEINALWYNALMIYSELAELYWNVAEGAEFACRAEIVKEAFRSTFWNDAAGCLFDYVDGDERDNAIRPNQIFALALPFPLMEGEQARSILRVIEEKLYTPVGLRSLSPDDPAYKPEYAGDQKSRDGAYHQGTVWSWLLGPFARAIVSVEGESGRARAKQVLEGILPHLQEAGIGTISEIFDGDPPHTPRGCIAQAWSVGEILRAYVEDAHGMDRRIQPATARTKQARRRHSVTRS